MDRVPRGASRLGWGKEIFGVAVVVGNSGQLSDTLRWARLQRFGPGEGISLVEMRALNRRRTEWLAVGAGRHHLVVVGTEFVQGLVVCGERDSAQDGVANAGQLTLFGVHGQRMCQDLEGVLRHVGKDIEDRLSVTHIVGEQDIGFCG